MRHPRQEGDHHAKGHPARAKDPRRARLKRLPLMRSLLHPQFLNVRRFSRRNQSAARTTPSKKRGHRHRQCSLQSSSSAKRLSDGNSLGARLRLLGSPGLEEKSGSRSVPAGNPVVAFRSGGGKSAAVDGGRQPAQRWSTSCVDGVRCVLPTYITNTYPHTPHSRVVSVRFCRNF